MTGAEAAAADDGDLRHHAVRDGVHHLGAGADDAAPFRLLAHHEAVDVVQEDERRQLLIAVQDEARGLFRRLGINDPAKVDALFARPVGGDLDVLFLIGDNPYGPAADARVAAKHGLAVFGAVFLERARVHDPRDDFPHVVLPGGVA